ncbi:MAG: hypothetical protein IR164_12605 [Devosia sp.]|jgi:hypothetical protein|uniref:hypothetical protein n=1 Tax=Devosia sp. TaxID=1871048 RepID=UPI0019DDEDFA|nr:hypothetical protein [Devosia sp.]MBF0679765.1 hypothetical protein [Devosia sp.]
MRFLPFLAAGLLGFFGAAAVHADSAGEAALFERNDPAFATLSLSREGDVWRLAFRAAGLPNGAATAADCEIVAHGAQDADDLITASVIPFEGELTSVTADDIGTEPLIIKIQMGPEGAFITDAGAAARLCGMGSDIDGFYSRIDTPA